MNDIIGRSLEKKELEEIFNSNDAEFVAVYGRRRVGKTYLIKNFFQMKKCIYFQTTGIYNGSLSEQLTRFAKEIGETFYGMASIKVPINWMDAFDELNRAFTRVPKNKKIVVFFDELPWMATRKSGVVSALEYFWNRYWVSNSKIKLIVCGSAASWIIKKIIKNRGGLHNRVTRKMRLLPFNLHDTFLFLKNIPYQCNQQQALKLYMIMGGVPFYLKQLKKNYSIDQNVEKLFFNSDSLFFDEFDEIFSSLFENSDQYKELITLIASCKDGISRKTLEEKSKLTGKGGRLTRRLEDLENAGFISSYIPFGHKKLGIFFRINDEYCYFYLRWIEAIKNNLKQDRGKGFWKKTCKTPEYFNWMGYAFENVCYKHIPQIKKALDIEQFSFSSSWRYVPRKGSEEKGAQIDLLFDRDDKAITICEIKYTELPYAIDKQCADNLMQKIQVFKKITHTNKQIFLAIISANDIKKTMYSEKMINGIVTNNDLFANEE